MFKKSSLNLNEFEWKICCYTCNFFRLQIDLRVASKSIWKDVVHLFRYKGPIDLNTVMELTTAIQYLNTSSHCFMQVSYPIKIPIRFPCKIVMSQCYFSNFTEVA